MLANLLRTTVHIYIQGYEVNTQSQIIQNDNKKQFPKPHVSRQLQSFLKTVQAGTRKVLIITLKTEISNIERVKLALVTLTSFIRALVTPAGKLKITVPQLGDFAVRSLGASACSSFSTACLK